MNALQRLQRTERIAILLLWGIAFSTFALESAPAAALGEPEVVGQWSAAFPWPIKAVHTMLLPNGEVLSYEKPDKLGTHLWDPATGLFE